MIEIIKHGNLFYINVCKTCGCEFLYQGSDIYLIENNDNRTYSPKVQCPECNTYCDANKKKYSETNEQIKFKEYEN